MINFVYKGYDQNPRNLREPPLIFCQSVAPNVGATVSELFRDNQWGEGRSC